MEEEKQETQLDEACGGEKTVAESIEDYCWVVDALHELHDSAAELNARFDEYILEQRRCLANFEEWERRLSALPDPDPDSETFTAPSEELTLVTEDNASALVPKRQEDSELTLPTFEEEQRAPVDAKMPVFGEGETSKKN